MSNFECNKKPVTRLLLKRMSLLILFFCFFFVDQGFSIGNNKTISVNEDIDLIQLSDELYVHTTWYDFPGIGRYPSNGLIFIKNGKALLIDTPVTNSQTKQLYGYLKTRLNVEIIKTIVTHYHHDCLGGLKYLQGLRIPSIASEKTKTKCIENNLPVPSEIFIDKMAFEFEGENVVCQYFGGGHTIDNIVVFFPDKGVLFGGCLIKSNRSTDLGNTKDAIIEEWGSTIEKIMSEYEDIDVVVPGHGTYGKIELLSHTMKLVNQNKNK